MGWKHNLPLVIINATNTDIDFNLTHFQGKGTSESWDAELPPLTTKDQHSYAQAEMETTTSSDNDNWSGNCTFGGKGKKFNTKERSMDVKKSFISITCTVTNKGFSIAGMNDEGDYSHSFLKWV